jgi:selenide,water dikinase
VARESRLCLEIRADDVPLLPGARALAPGHQAGGLRANRREFEPRVQYGRALDPALGALLFDPQTSGGLLLLVPEPCVGELLSELPDARAIGRATPPGAKPLIVL